MEIDTLFGLPAHPLIVHAAVVVLPIATIGLIVDGDRATRGTRRAGRIRAAWTIAVTIVSALVAAEPLVGGRLGKVSPKVVTVVLIGASLIGGVGATWTVIEVGHSGATSVWHDTMVSNDG